MRHIYFSLFILFSFVYSGLRGQEKNIPLITGQFKELKIEQFVQLLETTTAYHFYYDPVQFDSIQINLSVKEQPLKKVLELAFANTSFHFSMDPYNNVFLIRDKTIRTDLPPGFFGKIKNNNDSIINNTADIELTNNSKTT
ncbi:MAG TPA: hypothetical protein VKC90_03530, partial [Chitinophagaceae bacterium]|nr:hypothetical protein [Chitinophagaceae bacterium]